ncbi:MAG: hypothetical protein R6U32_02685 [Candidatus Woesearchaeota archaeon]
MKSKKGLTEADWAMSLGVFLLYLAWFFIVIKPAFSPAGGAGMPYGELKEAFYGEASWTVNRTPMIIRSNITGDNEPVIVDFPFRGPAEKYSVRGKYSVVDDGKLFFLANLHDRGDDSTMLYHLLRSTSNYTEPELHSGLTSSEEGASTADFRVNFEDGIVRTAYHRDRIKIIEYSLTEGGEPLRIKGSSHTSNSLFSRHKTVSSGVNHTTYVMLNNSRLYNFFDINGKKRVGVSVRLDPYSHYHAGGNEGGMIDYNQSGCDTYATDYIDLYDDSYGLSFIFDDDVELELCHHGKLVVNAESTEGGEFGYRLIFHEREEDAELMARPYNLIFGATEVMEGLSEEKLFNLEKEDYSSVRERWDYSYEFNITVMNSTSDDLFSFGSVPSAQREVSGRTYNIHLLGQNGSMERVSAALLTW